MKLSKETWAGILFCVLNGLLSVNCLLYDFTGRRAEESEKKSAYENRNRARTPDAMHTPMIEQGPLNRVLFPFRDGMLFCTELEEGQFETVLEESVCTKNPKSVQVKTELVFFPGRFHFYPVMTEGKIRIFFRRKDRENLILLHKSGDHEEWHRWGKDTSYRFRYMPEYNKTQDYKNIENTHETVLIAGTEYETFAVVPEKLVLKKSHYIKAGQIARSRQTYWSFWRAARPAAYLADVITFPIQYIGGWIYVLVFGIKDFSSL